MSDDLIRAGGSIGRKAGMRKGPLYQRAFGVPTPKPNIVSTPDLRLGLNDIPNEKLEIATRSYEGEQGVQKDVEYDRPLSVSMAKVNSPDMDSYSFDLQGTGIANAGVQIPAGAVNFPVVTVTISQGIRAICKKFGWYTNGANSNILTFGLYIGEELVMPGGRFVADQARTLDQYNPSGTQINDLSICADAHIPVEPDNDIRILVSNPGGAVAPAWGRLWGWHWEEETREDGRRAYYNTKQDKVVG